jgi:hypothetical protein
LNNRDCSHPAKLHGILSAGGRGALRLVQRRAFSNCHPSD